MIALGQFGSDYLAATEYVSDAEGATYALPSGMDIIAIQFVGTGEDGSKLSAMTAAPGSDCFVKVDTFFPDGLTVFGRWIAITVGAGSAAIVYYGPKL